MARRQKDSIGTPQAEGGQSGNYERITMTSDGAKFERKSRQKYDRDYFPSG